MKNLFVGCVKSFDGWRRAAAGLTGLLMVALGAQGAVAEREAFYIQFLQANSTVGSFSSPESFRNLVAEECVDYILKTTSGSNWFSVVGDELEINNSGLSRFAITLTRSYPISRIVVEGRGNGDDAVMYISYNGEVSDSQTLAAANAADYSEYSFDISGDESLDQYALVTEGSACVTRITFYENYDNGEIDPDPTPDPDPDPNPNPTPNPDPDIFILMPDIKITRTVSNFSSGESTIDSSGFYIDIDDSHSRGVKFSIYFNGDAEHELPVPPFSEYPKELLISPNGDYGDIKFEPGKIYYPTIVARHTLEDGSEEKAEKSFPPMLMQPAISIADGEMKSKIVTLTADSSARIIVDYGGLPPREYTGPVTIPYADDLLYYCTATYEDNEDGEETRAEKTLTSPVVYFENGIFYLGAKDVETECEVEERYYDLTGRFVGKVRPTTPGLYIYTDGLMTRKLIVR